MAGNGTSEQAPDGVIDTIGYAFGLLNRRPYLIWVPVLIDLVSWSGFRVLAVVPFSEKTGRFGMSKVLTSERLAEIELIAIATWPMPNLLGQPQFANPPSPVALSGVEMGGILASIVLLLSALASVALLATWITLVAKLVTDTPAGAVSLLTESARVGWQSVLIALGAVALITFMSIPMALVAAGIWLMGVNPLVLLILVLLLLSGWLGLFFVFSLPALAMKHSHVTTAMRSSYQFVQQNFLAVVGLLLIIVLIRAATPHALSMFASSQWSVPFAIIVNAYVVTGMLAAVLLFYQNRATRSVPSSAESSVSTRGL